MVEDPDPPSKARRRLIASQLEPGRMPGGRVVIALAIQVGAAGPRRGQRRRPIGRARLEGPGARPSSRRAGDARR